MAGDTEPPAIIPNPPIAFTPLDVLMQKYILRRVLLAIPAIIGLTIIIFLVMRILPGDVLTVMFGEEGTLQLSEEDRARIIASLGLDKPIYLQYVDWLQDIVTLKLGQSFWRSDTVMDLIINRGPITLEIAVFSVILSWLIGLPVGILAAMKRNSPFDYAGRFFSILFLAIPNFWLGTLIVLTLVLTLEWKAPLGVINLWEDPWANLQIIWGPALVLGIGQAAYICRMARSALLETIHEDYIRTARAKGLAERLVILRHALRNAIMPVITLSGVLLGFLIGGSVAVEQAFGVPGLGRTLVAAFFERDYVVIQNLVLIYGLVFVLTNLLVDISYAWIDPRIRYS